MLAILKYITLFDSQDLLILKATSSAALRCVEECFHMLQNGHVCILVDFKKFWFIIIIINLNIHAEYLFCIFTSASSDSNWYGAILFVNKLCLVSDCVVLLTVTFSLRAKYARSCFLTLTDNKSFISEICFQLKNLCLAKFKQKKRKMTL